MKSIISIIFLLAFLYNPTTSQSNDSQNKRVYAYLTAINFYHNNDLEAAIKVLLVEKNQNTDHPLINEINFLLAICYFDSGEWKSSFNYLKKLKNFDLLNDYIIYFKAESLRKLGQNNESLKLFKELVNTYPQTRWKKKAHQSIFQLNYRIKHFKSAMTAFKRHRLQRYRYSKHDRDIYPNFLLTYAISNLHHNRTKEASLFLKKLIIFNPETKEAATARNLLKRHKKTFSTYELIRLAESQISKSKINDVTKTLALMKKRKIKNEAILSLKGRLFMRHRMYNKAIPIFKSILNTKSHPKLIYNLATCYDKLSMHPKARYYYRKVVNKHPKYKLATQALFMIARLYASEGNYAEAVKTFDQFIKKYPKSRLASAAKWEKGWNEYNRENYQEAISIFDKSTEGLKSNDITLSKLMYWQARSYQNLGKTEKASGIFFDIVKDFSYHYYAYLAENRLIEINPDNAEKIKELNADTIEIVKASKKITCDNIEVPRFKADLSKNELIYFTKAQKLIKVGLEKYASSELHRIQRTTKKRPVLKSLANFFHCLHDYNKAQYIARVHFKNKLEDPPAEDTVRIWKLAFPKGYSHIITKLSNHLNLSPYLILALMRAESSFREDVVSSANAIGLMQIIPPTGRKIAEKLHDKNFKLSDLLDPKTNITFGTWYLSSLTNSFDGNIILAIPSYNAGPHNVKKWIRQYGSKKIDEFVESVPYRETRNYIKRVVRNYGVYKTLYSKNKTMVRLGQTLKLNQKKLRKPSAQNENMEDWDQYKEDKDFRPKLYFINKFTLDKLSLIEYFSLNSFKRYVQSRSF